MKVNAASLFRLLKPHARPYYLPLALVFVFGSVTAITSQAPYLLLAPTWQLMFPGPAPQEGERDVALEFIPEESHDAYRESLRADPAESEDEDAQASRLARVRQWAIGWVLGDGDQPFDDDQRIRLLWRVVGIMALLALFSAVMQYGLTVLSRWVAVKMVVSLRMEIARHLMRLSLRYHSTRKLGDVLSRVAADVGTTLQVVNIFMRELVQEPIMAVTALVLASIIAPQATLFVILGLPILLVPVAMLLRKIRKRSKRTLDQLGESVHVLLQMFGGVRTVKAFRAEERELERYRRVNDDFVHASMKMFRSVALSRSWSIFYSHVGLGVILLFVGWLAISRGVGNKPELMLVFFFLISRAYNSIKISTRGWGGVAEAMGACERLQALLDETPDIVEVPNAKPATGIGSGLRFDGITFAYPEGNGRAIEDLTIDIERGETLALVGPSGAGKSTFIDLVARFIDPQEGRVLIDGVDLRELDLTSWTERYAMVTQEPFLFHASIEENIRYGKPDATLEEIEDAARAANIHDFIAGLPEAYNTNVADAGTRLSGGQRQRITIARAILHGGELLLLDEATSALDTESESVVQAALENLMRGQTVIVIAHRLSTIRNADRIAVLDEGRLVELGTHEELLAGGGLYARLHAMQFQNGSQAAEAEKD